MKQDEMIAMLKRVIKENQNYTTWTVSTPHLMQLVNNAIELEREACAKVCDAMEEKAEGTECCKWPTPIDCAHAIRARKKA